MRHICTNTTFRTALVACALSACGPTEHEDDLADHAEEVITELCEEFADCLEMDPTLPFVKYDSVERCVFSWMSLYELKARHCQERLVENAECHLALTCEETPEECSDEHEASTHCVDNE